MIVLETKKPHPKITEDSDCPFGSLSDAQSVFSSLLQRAPLHEYNRLSFHKDQFIEDYDGLVENLNDAERRYHEIHKQINEELQKTRVDQQSLYSLSIDLCKNLQEAARIKNKLNTIEERYCEPCSNGASSGAKKKPGW